MEIRHLKLNIGGADVTDVIVQHVSVGQALNDHWWCHTECRHTQDQRGPATPPGSDQKESAVTVEHWLGQEFRVFESGAADNLLFHGFVLEVELIYELSGSFTAIIQAATKSFKMDVTPRLAYYEGMSLASLASQLAGNAGLSARVMCKDRRPLNYVQWHESDFQFLHRLADDHGCWLRPCEDGVELYDSFQEDEKLIVYWRAENGVDALKGFSISGKLAPPKYSGAHYDFHTMKSKIFQDVSQDPQFFDSIGPLVGRVKQGSKDNLPSGYLDHRSRTVTLDEYEELLKKESVRSIGGSVTASGESTNTKLLPGQKVTIDGTLDASGVYGLIQVTHNWDPTGYTNQFTCTPWQNYIDPHPPQVKPWLGAVPARVVDHNDPKKMGRVRVQYFWQEDGPLQWARMMTPHAGSDRGFMFMPEVGDEVVVTFEDGDPERPVILGCVWNGVDTAPRQEFWGGELNSNDIKRIVTKSGHRIQLVDKPGKEAIVLATPNRLRISLIEKADETGRSMILLHSEDGDMFLSAPNGRVHIRSKFYSKEIGE